MPFQTPIERGAQSPALQKTSHSHPSWQSPSKSCTSRGFKFQRHPEVGTTHAGRTDPAPLHRGSQSPEKGGCLAAIIAPIDGLCLSQALHVPDCVTMSTWSMGISLRPCFQFCGCIPKVESLDHMGILFLIFGVTTILLSQQLYHVRFPATV